jgi:hypothetical protein
MGDLDKCKKIEMMRKDLKPIIDKKPIDQTELNNFFKKYNIEVSNTFNTKVINNCGGVTAQIGINQVTIDPECVKIVKETCAKRYTNQADIDNCYKKYRPKIFNVTQTNESQIQSNCAITTILEDDVAKKNEEFAATLNLLLADTKLDCELLNLSNNNNSFVNVFNTCVNDNLIDQRNIINACYLNNAVQENLATITSSCIMKAANIPIESQPDLQESGTLQPSSQQPSSQQVVSTTTNNFIPIIIISVIIFIIIIGLMLLLLLRNQEDYYD